jgi:hypothetical protein
MKYHNKKNTTQKKSQKKFNTDLCTNKMTFQECEIAILRHAIDVSDAVKGHRIVRSDDINDILKIVEDFIIRKKLICYGGTALNNILPKIYHNIGQYLIPRCCR